MADINATLPFLEPFAVTFQSLINVVQIVVGGIFGLYVIMLFVRIFYFAKFLKLFKVFKQELRQLSEKVDSMSRKLDKISARKK